MQYFANLQVDANAYANGASRTSAQDDYRFGLYTPDAPGQYKVIVFSHPIAGSPVSAQALAEAWTAQGYIVIAPVHADSPDSLVGSLAAGLTDKARWEFRTVDAKIALDIAVANQTNPGGGVIPDGYAFDVSEPVMIGHSFGANITSIIAGARPTFDGVTYDWADNRFVAAIALSGSGAEGTDVPFEAGAFDTIDVPFLRVTGAHDYSPETADPADRMDGVLRNHADVDTHGVFVGFASHRSLVHPSDNDFGLDPDPAASFAASVNATILFLDAYVDGDATALATLEALDISASQLGTEGADTATLGSGAEVYFARGGNDSIIGGAGADQLFGQTGSDTLAGGSGDDLLNGGSGADNMQGGADNDFYVVNTASDVVVESAGQGTDTVFADVTYTLPSNVENLILSQSDLWAIGVSLDGTGNSSNNTITGNTKGNVLTGLGGADTIEGGAGNDTLVGGAGADVLDGGGDNDRFDLNATSESPSGAGRDQILVFDAPGAAAGDIIDVSTIDAKTTAGGNQSFSFIGTGAFTAAGQIRAVDDGANVILQFNTDNNLSTVEMEIYVVGVADPASFTAADFLL